MITLLQLKYAIAVAEHGNFTDAAERCFVTQPTLSMQVKKMEEELGIKLFNRATKPVVLTAVGEKVLQQARKVMDEAQRVEDIVATEKGAVEGVFRLGIIPTVMPTLLPLFLKNFINKYPKVDLKIEELTTELMATKLIEGRLDAGIAATPLDHGRLLERPLYYEPFVGYVPKAHALTKTTTLDAEDLNGVAMLVLEDGHCFREHVFNLCNNRDVSLKHFDLKSGSFETLINLSNEGLGMTLLPFLHTTHLPEIRKEQLRNFNAPAPAREISLINTKSQLKIAIINALVKVINGVMRGAIQFDDVDVVMPTRNS